MALSKDRLGSLFEAVNEDLDQLEEKVSVDVILIGGAAMMLMSPNARATMDVDVFLLHADNFAAVAAIFRNYGIDIVTVASVPDPEDMNPTPVFEFSHITVFIPDWYNLAITKLFSTRDEEADLLEYILPNIEDWDKLATMVEDYKIDYVGDIRRTDANRIEEYRKMLEHETK